ncbi:hypothetical protein [Brevundimonas sp. UBA2416]|uniref:hypothetical protein n=1 Tax=Brevundimonas sp. UBA2416 TaxID=1946124 RepID=UPI0025C3CAE7|nr:hypothetical protein [Brevundimonas sp. UBA2416]HRJ63320.1 hypothetical protein [Brevundimonas sp.]
MKKIALVVGMAATLFATAAEAMTVQEFLTAASRIPRNPTALLRADTRRLIAEIRTASETIGNEREAAIAAGRRPAFCPAGGRASVSADALLARFNAIPPARRNISVTQAMREWMAERHPCPAS